MKETKPLIITFLKYQLIQPCQSLCNTPVLLVQKSGTWDYHFLQKLRLILNLWGWFPTSLKNVQREMGGLKHKALTSLKWFCLLKTGCWLIKPWVIFRGSTMHVARRSLCFQDDCRTKRVQSVELSEWECCQGRTVWSPSIWKIWLLAAWIAYMN